MTKKHTVTILLALLLCLMAAGPAYGMEQQQQRTIQAFRLLKNIGLIQALPASDEELMSLDRFEKANIVAQAAERAASALEAQSEAQRAQAALAQSGHGDGAQAELPQPQLYQAAVLESLAWLESVFYEELIQLNKAPHFLALTGEAARDMGLGAGGVGVNGSGTIGAAGEQLPLESETYPVYVNSSPVRTYQMIITTESNDAQAKAGAETATGTDNSTTISVPIMF
jgi:hypothetical protein